MPLPHWLGRFNRVASNHVMRPLARHLPGMGIVVHQGRRSGREYRTPVNVFPRDGGLTVALTYGSKAEWVKNVLAADRAQIVRRGRTYPVVNPRVEQDTERTAVPRPVRPILRSLNVDEFLLVDHDGEA